MFHDMDKVRFGRFLEGKKSRGPKPQVILEFVGDFPDYTGKR